MRLRDFRLDPGVGPRIRALTLRVGLAAMAMTGAVPQPAQAAPPQIVSVSAGYGHACALDMNRRVWCWGYNTWGQLGLGDPWHRSIPARIPGLTDVVALSAGVWHTCAVRAEGTVWCWGRNGFNGSLGDGTTEDRFEPVQVADIHDAWNVAAGGAFTCAQRRDGAVSCWGWNTGSFGDGTGDSSAIPVPSEGFAEMVELVAGGGHACGRRSDGTVHCSGQNDYGQLGNGTDAMTLAPRAVPDLRARRVAAGQWHSCAVRTDGRAACWGRNSNGQMGDGSAGAHPLLPVTVRDLTAQVDIAVGDAFSCASSQAGTVACWGNNEWGQLGRGTVAELGSSDANQPNPRMIQGLNGVVRLAAGRRFACGLLSTGSVACWGDNIWGQLGNGASTEGHDHGPLMNPPVPVPRLVLFPDDIDTASTSVVLSVAAAPASVDGQQTVNFTATVTSGAGVPTGQVSFQDDGVEFTSGPLDEQGVATASWDFPVGSHQITAVYLGAPGFAASTSNAVAVQVQPPPPLEFLGGGTVFGFTAACASGGWANTPHPARLRYGPGETNGMPSQVGILFPSGAEHLQTWQPLAQSTLNYDALGRQMWTLFVLQQPFPRMTPVQRRITQPAGGTDIATATEVMLRLRVSNFGGIVGCGATVAGVLRRGG